MLSNFPTPQPVKYDFAYGSQNSSLPLRGESVQRVGQSREFMKQHFNQNIKITLLAAQAGISVSHFFKLFRQDTGCAPLVYLTRLRIDRACELLMTSAWSIKQIAVNLGYNDPLYFSRVFKSSIGMAPLQYRRSKRNNSALPVPGDAKNNFSRFGRG